MDFMNVSHNKARQQKNAGSANTGASEKLEVVKEEKREKSRDRSRNREERGERGERGGREERGRRDRGERGGIVFLKVFLKIHLDLAFFQIVHYQLLNSSFSLYCFFHFLQCFFHFCKCSMHFMKIKQ